MNIELARKLLGVDGSNQLMLETAWHHRRTQILEAQTDSDAEAAEKEALLDNLDLASAVIKDATASASREQPAINDGPLHLNMNDTWRNVMIGLATGTVVAITVIVFIAWLTGHLGS